jgi:putative ABC transport system permease protein
VFASGTVHPAIGQGASVTDASRGNRAARAREFGIRVALGSQRRAIAALVLRQGAGWMAAGAAGGAFGVLLVARAMRDLLFDVFAFAPLTLAVATAVLGASSTLAVLAPVYRATAVDPATTLRVQ